MQVDEVTGGGSEDWSSEATADKSSPLKGQVDDGAIGLLVPIGRSGWAILAGYLGLACIALYPSPLAILTGVLAIRDIRKNPEKRGLGRAWFAIVAGIAGTIGLVLWLQSDYS